MARLEGTAAGRFATNSKGQDLKRSREKHVGYESRRSALGALAAALLDANENTYVFHEREGQRPEKQNEHDKKTRRC